MYPDMATGNAEAVGTNGSPARRARHRVQVAEPFGSTASLRIVMDLWTQHRLGLRSEEKETHSRGVGCVGSKFKDGTPTLIAPSLATETCPCELWLV